MDSQQNVQVGVTLKHPAISPLSLRERARVRGFSLTLYTFNQHQGPR